MSGASTPSGFSVGRLQEASTSSRFGNHRFDNHSAWLDREERLKAKKEGRHLGHGFAEQRPPPAARPEKPFTVCEPAFTSGLMVQRTYQQVECGYKTEDERTDPYHYPNHLEVKDDQHYGDFRRRSQNLDPRAWKPDPKMAHIVTDEMVKSQLSAHLGQNRKYTDPKLMATLFDNGVKPNVATLHELNADLSCIDLNHREGGSAASRAAARVGGGRPAASKSGSDWSWCLGGRKVMVSGLMDPEERELVKSQSLPQMTLANGDQPSMLYGNLGGSSTNTFHGLHTRKFGGNDLRMRGGMLARDGWAGTFPSKEATK